MLPIRKHMRKVAPPISNKTKGHDIVDGPRNRERWHHVAPRPLQMVLDEIQGALKVCEPGGFRDLRVRCEIGAMPSPSADIPLLHGFRNSKGCAHWS